ncbi:MAG: septal ring lytic transglycosylase RlpA family protein [Proteobacteria bacterium]|nr:septal ring lytic transglycosylase RlpA family protein [Pseudomonadota bacterium]
MSGHKMMFRGQRTKVAWVVGFMLLVGACAQTRLAIHAVKQIGNRGGTPGAEATISPEGVPIGPGGVYKVGDSYQVAGRTYTPRVDPDYDETGIASWYGKDFNGLRTANGEIFDMNALTAAHKTLPLPSYVRVTNLENGRTLVLRVNDRGPFVAGRIIDVSRRSAQLLGFRGKGTARVRVRVVAAPLDGGFVAAKAETPKGTRVAVAVPVGPVETDDLAPPEGIAEAPRRRGPAFQPQVSVGAVRPTSMYVQAGAFESFDNANRLSAKLSTSQRWRITSVVVRGRELYRVRYGPLETVEQADIVLARVIRKGHPEARIVID